MLLKISNIYIEWTDIWKKINKRILCVVRLTYMQLSSNNASKILFYNWNLIWNSIFFNYVLHLDKEMMVFSIKV